MFYFPTVRKNGIAYLLWRWLLRNNGKFISELDKYYFGSSRGMNDYDFLASSYKKSNVKPDKQFSILPTVLKMVGNCKNKVVVDIGCGSGFFTIPLAELGASNVYGLDNSRAQIELAEKISPHPIVSYLLSDVFVDQLVPADIMVVPFVMNYARTIPILSHFFKQIHTGLRNGGKVVFVIDLPNGKSLKRFGAVKTLRGLPIDETDIQIDLFNEERKICTLTSIYYTPKTIKYLLKETGFRNVHWYKPIVSKEGICSMGPDFWKGYTADSELGYLTAEK